MRAERYGIIAILGAVLVFSNTIFMEFVWDDLAFIVDNPFVQSLKNLPLFFVNGMPKIDVQIHYRPLMMASLAADFALWGHNPFGFHLTSVVLHGAAAYFVFMLSRRLAASAGASLTSALLFALHPVHSDAVAWVMARADLLCAFFTLSAFYCHLSRAQGGRRWTLWGAVGMFSAGLLSKETAVMFPAAVFAFELAVLRKGARKAALLSAVYLVPLAAYGVARYLVLGGAPYQSYSFGERLMTSPGLILRYIEMTFLPFRLKVLYHGIPVEQVLFSTPVIMSAVGAAVVGCLVLVFRRNRFILFGALWYLIFLFPVSGIPAIIDVAPIADRYLYVPLAGLLFSFGAAASAANTGRGGRLIPVVVATVLLAAGTVTFMRNYLWRDQFTFLSRMVADAPAYPDGHTVLGVEYLKRGDAAGAEEKYRTALRIDERTYKAHNNLAVIFIERGKYAQAIEHLEKALALSPDYGHAWNNLGVARERQNDLSGAEKAYREAYVTERLKSAVDNLRNIYVKMGKKQHEIFYELGLLYLDCGEIDTASDMFARAIAVAPTFADGHNGLGVTYVRKGKVPEALEHFSAAMTMDQDNPEYRRNYEQAAGQRGESK